MGRAGNVDEDDDDGVDDLHAILDARSPSTDDSNGFVALLCIGPIFIFKPADDVHHPPGTFEAGRNILAFLMADNIPLRNKITGTKPEDTNSVHAKNDEKRGEGHFQ
jgi:hypothetical protein